MEQWEHKVAIVTGASFGIGKAIAEQLVNNGLTVVGLARQKEKIEDLAKTLIGRSGTLYAVRTNITKENDILEALSWVKTNVGQVHILINNAGVVRPNGLLDGSTKDWIELLHTNVLGLSVITREVVRNMMCNNVKGHIIHINSLAGHYVPQIPNLNVYTASKHAVTALTETLRQELNLKKSHIKVTSISPGTVATNISSHGSFDADPNHFLDAADIADAVCYVLGTPPHVQVHELIIRPQGEKI